MNNSVSIIISLYNYQDYIVGAIESAAAALEQINHNGEIIVVDDASTDGGLTAAKACLRRLDIPHKIYSNQKNQGLSAVRNRAVSMASYPWIFVLDADNRIYSHCLKVLLEEAIAKNADAVYGISEKFDTKANQFTGLLSAADWCPEQLESNPYIDAMALFRRSILQAYRYDESLKICHEDYDLWLRLATDNRIVVFSPQVVGIYNVHEQSMLNRTKNKKIEQINEKIRKKVLTPKPSKSKALYSIRIDTDEEALIALGYLSNFIRNNHRAKIWLFGSKCRDLNLEFFALQKKQITYEKPQKNTIELKLKEKQKVEPSLVRRQILNTANLTKCPIPISVITPTYNTGPDQLEQCIDSMRSQLYPFWEWVILDDGSSSASVHKILDKVSALDHRIKVHKLNQNKGVSIATDIAINLSSGEFTLFLDHDDFLTDNAVLSVAEVLSEDPTIDAVYTAIHVANKEGQWTETIAKDSRWPESFQQVIDNNYYSHFRGFRKDLFGAVGSHDSSLNGIQDYDWLVRAIKGGYVKNPRFIPKPVYYWRCATKGRRLSITTGYQNLRRKLIDKHGYGKDWWSDYSLGIEYGTDQ